MVLVSATDTMAMLFPNVATTRDISVRVAVSYLAEQSDPSSERWFWSYSCADRERLGPRRPLLSRSWHIVDGRGSIHEVHGEGVVGEMPLIAPGGSFDYVPDARSTRRPLDERSYRMVDEEGTAFDVTIPRFNC